MGSHKKRPVALTAADREELVRVTATGIHPASMIRRARVLLALDTSVGEVDPKEVIAARVGVSGETLRLVAKRFADIMAQCHLAKVDQATSESERMLTRLMVAGPSWRVPWSPGLFTR